jgi:hypothetical protein
MAYLMLALCTYDGRGYAEAMNFKRTKKAPEVNALGNCSTVELRTSDNRVPLSVVKYE